MVWDLQSGVCDVMVSLGDTAVFRVLNCKNNQNSWASQLSNCRWTAEHQTQS